MALFTLGAESMENPEDELDACCGECGSMFHSTESHGQAAPAMARGLVSAEAADEFPPGYDPAEADRLIGRDPDAPQ